MVWTSSKLASAGALPIVAASAMVLAVLAVPANAQPVAGVTTHRSPTGEVSSATQVSPQAWAAGRARYGPKVTAAQAVQSFWTPQRMRQAKPIEEMPFYQNTVRKQEQQVRDAKLTAQKAPDRAAPPPPVHHQVEPRAGALDSRSTLRPLAADPGWDSWQPTARTYGRVFINTPAGVAHCSGTIVNSEGQDTVWTAGHCVHTGEGGYFYSDWTFVPGYDDDLPDSRPFGTWVARILYTKAAWVDSSENSDDMGVAIMWPNDAGTKIVAFFGGQGITTGVGATQWQNSFGYPGEPPFDGGNLEGCAGFSEPEWQVLWFWSETIEISCDMTRGASGGGWLAAWDGNWGYLNGVNSRIDQAVGPTVALSPYFDDTAWSLYNATRGL